MMMSEDMNDRFYDFNGCVKFLLGVKATVNNACLRTSLSADIFQLDVKPLFTYHS